MWWKRVVGGSVMVLINEKTHVASLQMPNDDVGRSQQWNVWNYKIASPPMCDL